MRDAKPYVCRNPACQDVLGYVIDKGLVLGSVIIFRGTVLVCQTCGQENRWKSPRMPG